MLAAVAHWLYLNVTGNLIADAISFAAGWAWAHRKIAKLHRVLDHHGRRLDALHQHLTQERPQ